MVDRVGDWYAFSRTSFCRRLTLYDNLPWREARKEEAEEAMMPSSSSLAFSLAAAEMVAVAPFGGLLAVLGHAADFASASSLSPSFTVLSSSFASPRDGSPRPTFNLSAHAAATSALTTRALHVFTSAAELLTTIPLTGEEVGEANILALGWTPEGELFVLLDAALTVVFFDMRDVALAASTASSSSSSGGGNAPSRATRRVSLRPDHAAPRVPSSSAPPAAMCITSAGLLCVDGNGSGRLCGLLHEEHFRSSLVPSVRLPLQSFSPSAAAAAGQQASGRTVVRPHVSALEMVPPAWNDSGDFLVLWAQHDVAVSGRTANGRAVGQDGVVSALCAMVLPDGEIIDCGDDDGDMSATMMAGGGGGAAVATAPSWPAARLACEGRVLSLSVCVADPTRAAVFTSLGVLHVVRTNLSSMLYSVDLGLCRVLRDIAAQSGGGADIGSFSGNGPLMSQSFAFGDVPWRQRDDATSAATAAGVNNNNNSSFAGGSSMWGAAAADDGDLSLHGSFSPTAARDGGVGNGSAALSPVCPPPYKLEWCGGSFALLHFYHADFQQGSGFAPERRDAAMFSLLVPTQKDCSVRCERLDWSLDGSGHIVSVAEADGVRVVSDTTCYLLQEVPSCLARLCRVQPPFPPAAQVVLAYEAYMGGDQHGIALVRAALADGTGAESGDADNDVDDEGEEGEGQGQEHGMSHAEGIVYELLDAASHELDVEQQYRFIAAASFAGETIRLRSGVPDVIVDVTRRLRVLRAVRQAPHCHLPLTIAQYQALTGNEERPARRLSSSEGSVLVDRLTYLGYYQLALDVVRALHMKPARVLSRWASSFVRRHVASLSDAAVHHELAQVLRNYPTASYVEPASTAFHLGRRELALRLLRDEPQQQRQRVLLCVQMGELAMAGRAAAASGSAELIHLVVCALVAKEAQTHQAALREHRKKEGEELEENEGKESEQAAAVEDKDAVTTGDVYHCLIASPELLCWLLSGAQCLASWQSVARRLLLFSRHWSLASLACQHELVQALRLSSVMHRAELQRYVTDVVETLHRRETGDGGGSDAEGEAGREQRKGKAAKQKKHRHRKKRNADESGGDEAPNAASDGEAEESNADGSSAHFPLPPPLRIPVPTAAAAAASLLEWSHKTNGALVRELQHTEKLRQSNAASSARPPFSVIVETAERVRAETQRAAMLDGDSASKGASPRSRGGLDQRTSDDVSSFNSAASSVLAHEACVRTVLSTPATLPARDAAALRKEEEFAQLKVRLAVKHNEPRLSRVVSVFDLLYELAGLEDSEEDAKEVQRAFKVGERIVFYATLRGLCAAQRWPAVDRLLGPAPPLRKRSFFASSDGPAAKPPCVGYLPVVHLLMACKQEERAARYVAGACSAAVDRVVLYMALGAPVMALEAALVEKDGGLIQQIMQRVPASAKVQAVGQQMLDDLRGD